MKIIFALLLTGLIVSILWVFISKKVRYYDAWTDVQLRSKAKNDE